MPDIKPGLYADMTTTEYFGDPCPEPSLSQSIAKIMLAKSPRHAWIAHPQLNPDWTPNEKKYREDTAIGNAGHKLVLGRGKAFEVIRIPERKREGNKWVVPDPAKLVDADDMLTDAAKEAFKSINASGGMPILRKHLDVAEIIRDAAREQLDLAGCPEAFRDQAALRQWILEDQEQRQYFDRFANDEGHPEVVMIAYDKEHDIWLRSMTDWLVSYVRDYDLKTGKQSAAPHEIPRRMIADGWDIQAAMKERILDILDPRNRGRRCFRYVAIEDDEPYGLTVNELPESVMEAGRRKVRHACHLWAECLRSGEWPGYPPMVNRPELPTWEEKKWLDREVSEAAAGRWATGFYAPLPEIAE